MRTSKQIDNQPADSNHSSLQKEGNNISFTKNNLPFFNKRNTIVQRKCAECEKEEKLQKKSAMIQMQEESGPTSTLESSPSESLTTKSGTSETSTSKTATSESPTSEGGASSPAREGPTNAEQSDQQGQFIVDDSAIPADGQMRKSDFLERLNAEVSAAVDDALRGSPFFSNSSSYIRSAFARYQNSSALQLEQTIQIKEPSTRSAQSAQDIIQRVKIRVYAATTRWLQTGDLSDVPKEIADQIPTSLKTMAGIAGTATSVVGNVASGIGNIASGIESVASGIGDMLFKSGEGGAHPIQSPHSVMQSLGRGHTLDARSKGKMESAFDANFSNVEVHTDNHAAVLSKNMNARAFTVGNHIAFANGEHKPGTLVGDALMAHELAHVVQQDQDKIHSKNFDYQDQLQLEQDADHTAINAMMHLSGIRGGLTKKTKPKIKTALKLSRCGGKAPPPPALVVRPPDLHSGSQIPDSSRLGNLKGELAPGSVAPGGIVIPWDGASVAGVVSATALAKRKDLKKQLTAAMANHLKTVMKAIKPMSTKSRIPISEFEGPGKAAKTVVDAHFGNYTAQAALTALQKSTRSSFSFSASGANKNLFDANDKTERSKAGMPVDALDLAGWIANSDKVASAVSLAHHFNPDATGEQGDFFRDNILKTFVSSHKADLELYDLFGFAISDEKRGRVVIGTVPDGSLSSTGSGGVPSPAIRKTKWDGWKTLVHEYFHQLAHPAFNRAAEGGQVNSRVMTEGFAELFTKEVLLAELPGAAGNVALRNQIEGGSFPSPSPDIVGTYDPGTYADYLKHAENIRDTVIGSVGGPEAVKSAFFQGHVEFIGLNPDGSWITPVTAGAADMITVPAGISTLDQLADGTGLSTTELQAVNPGLSSTSPLPSTVHAPGCREHIVVEARNTTSAGIVIGRQVESKAQIATQNGVVEADLDRANPTVHWALLTEGQHILIPKH